MKNAFLLILMVCVVGITNINAQSENVNWNAYISDRMAQKIADGILKAYPANEREMRIQLFMNANNISSVSTCADILYNLKNHKGEAANFILAIFSSWPMITPNYFFQSIGFNEIEIEWAVKAGTKKQEILREEEDNKKKREERAVIERWNKEGKDIMTFGRYDERYGRFHPVFVFYTRISGVLDSIKIQPEELGGYIPKKSIEFIVDEYGRISDDFLKEIKQYGMDSVYVKYPADRRFEKLDTVIAVPSRNYFGVTIQMNEMRDANTSYVATVKYDKKIGKWNMKECENKYGKLKDWFAQSQRWIGAYERLTPKKTMGFDSYEAIVDWMNEFFNTILQGKEGKKYQIEFTFVPMGNVSYYINRCFIGKFDLKPRIQVDSIKMK